MLSQQMCVRSVHFARSVDNFHMAGEARDADVPAGASADAAVAVVRGTPEVRAEGAASPLAPADEQKQQLVLGVAVVDFVR